MNTVRAIIDALRRAPDFVLPLVREVPPILNQPYRIDELLLRRDWPTTSEAPAW